MNTSEPKDMPLYLSIVVPLYNEEECVEKLLSGILEVTRQFDFAYEIIFIDDGSKDNTWTIIERLKRTIAETFNVDPQQISESTTQGDIGAWDSLGQVNLMIALESEFNLFLEPEDIQKLTSVAAILNYLNKCSID